MSGKKGNNFIKIGRTYTNRNGKLVLMKFKDKLCCLAKDFGQVLGFNLPVKITNYWFKNLDKGVDYSFLTGELLREFKEKLTSRDADRLAHTNAYKMMIVYEPGLFKILDLVDNYESEKIEKWLRTVITPSPQTEAEGLKGKEKEAVKSTNPVIQTPQGRPFAPQKNSSTSNPVSPPLSQVQNIPARVPLLVSEKPMPITDVMGVIRLSESMLVRLRALNEDRRMLLVSKILGVLARIPGVPVSDESPVDFPSIVAAPEQKFSNRNAQETRNLADSKPSSVQNQNVQDVFTPYRGYSKARKLMTYPKGTEPEGTRTIVELCRSRELNFKPQILSQISKRACLAIRNATGKWPHLGYRETSNGRMGRSFVFALSEIPIVQAEIDSYLETITAPPVLPNGIRSQLSITPIGAGAADSLQGTMTQQ